MEIDIKRRLEFEIVHGRGYMGSPVETVETREVLRAALAEIERLEGRLERCERVSQGCTECAQRRADLEDFG